MLQVLTNGYEGAKTKAAEQVIAHIFGHTAGMAAPIGRVSVTPEGVVSAAPQVLIVKNGKIIQMENAHEAGD